DYEFVVTPYEGLLDTLSSPANTDFDAVLSNLVIPDLPPENITYTDPYLEVGQVVVVLADEQGVQSYRDIQPGMAVGVAANSSGSDAARDVLNLASTDIIEFDTTTDALQALTDGQVTVAIIDSYTATHFVNSFPEQIKIAGAETGRDAWITRKAYGIAVAAHNQELLDVLNSAIAQAQSDQTIDRLIVAWLIPEETIDPGEPRLGTPASELIIGILANQVDMDPASEPDLVEWELKVNTMSGLFTVNGESEIVPMLAADFPEISDDKLEYTFRLRPGLRFPDGSEFTAEDVKWAIDRSARLGSFLVNSYLKDSNDDNFADEDAVQVVDSLTVKVVLQEPTGYFLSLLATPPYFPISSECYLESWDLLSNCGGIGPYTIATWTPNDRMRLKANPEWPGRPSPAFENIQIRFYADTENMRRSLVEFESIDMAWTGLPYAVMTELRRRDVDEDGTVDFKSWQGPAAFKSYLIFEQETPPWDDTRVRQAVAYAVDREALAQDVFVGGRTPLFSPVPTGVPGATAVFPQRDLDRARALLQQAGYSEARPLAITLWYNNDAHYTPLEETYAEAIKTQLEETGIFQVTLSSEIWDTYRAQLGQCNYPAYLLGWPTPGRPANYLDMTSWTDFFIQNTSTGFCSNYESAQMEQLNALALAETDLEQRNALYAQIQALWAEDLPTLDLLQESRHGLSLNKVDGVIIDGMGLMHYELLTKSGG
ncbi:MAG: ABC transporter substrate-binding protein, partial [Anaerolineae bacterium]